MIDTKLKEKLNKNIDNFELKSISAFLCGGMKIHYDVDEGVFAFYKLVTKHLDKDWIGEASQLDLIDFIDNLKLLLMYSETSDDDPKVKEYVEKEIKNYNYE